MNQIFVVKVLIYIIITLWHRIVYFILLFVGFIEIYKITESTVYAVQARNEIKNIFYIL